MWRNIFQVDFLGNYISQSLLNTVAVYVLHISEPLIPLPDGKIMIITPIL